MTKLLLFLLGVATGLALVAGAVLSLIHGGISARPEPPKLEVVLARTLRRWAIPAAARELRNPEIATSETLAEARAHFADHCASCHGNDGRGDTPIGRALYPRAPDMRLDATQKLSDGEIFYIIENGIRLTGMPAWGVPGSETESWKLVHFIRHLPKLTAAEIAEMEKLNPRSPEELREMEEEERFLRGEDVESSHAGHHAH